MPLTLTLSEHVLPEGKEKEAFSRLAQAMLDVHGLAGNRFMTQNLVGSINVIKPAHTFAGLSESPVAFIEWKVPSFAFSDREIQKAYVARATDIVYELSGGKLQKDHIWVNVTHAVDGTWGIAGKAMTNDELKQAVAQSSASC